MTDENDPEDRDLLVRLDGGDEQAVTELITRAPRAACGG